MLVKLIIQIEGLESIQLINLDMIMADSDDSPLPKPRKKHVLPDPQSMPMAPESPLNLVIKRPTIMRTPLSLLAAVAGASSAIHFSSMKPRK